MTIKLANLILKNVVDTFRIVAVAACVYVGLHEPLHNRLGVRNGVVWLASLGLTFFLLRGPAILTRRKIGLVTYGRHDPVFWAAFPVFAASGYFALVDMGTVRALAIITATVLYVIGSKRTQAWYFAKAERAVTAQICPAHGKKAVFEVRRNGNRPYMWVEGCCVEARDRAKAAVREVFCA